MSKMSTLPLISDPPSNVIPTPANLPEFVPYACNQMMAPFNVRFNIRTREEYIGYGSDNKTRKPQRSRMSLSEQGVASLSKNKSLKMRSASEYDEELEMVVVAAAVLDSADHLVEISIERCQEVPRLLIRIIAFCIPFNPFLCKFTIRCRLPGTTLYEIVKVLTVSHITEVCLDDSHVPDRNYYLLLEYQTQVHCLSLARCNITDDDCSLLIPNLIYPLPASKTLKTLNLSGNFISDEGARLIGQALRSNRTLLYLNLSGNTISDDGAVSILRSLIEFPMTAEEICLKRKRSFRSIKLRKEIYAKFYTEMIAALPEKSDESVRAHRRRNPTSNFRSRKHSASLVNEASQLDLVAVKAATMTDELMNRYPDPFIVQATVCRDNCLYCKGNLTLTYLNLRYNNLGYQSVVKLLEVATYQAVVGKQPNVGLMTVQLEGNPVPLCSELEKLSTLLSDAVKERLHYIKSASKRHERSKKPKIPSM